MNKIIFWSIKLLLILLLSVSFSIYSQAQENRSGIRKKVMKLCDQSFQGPGAAGQESACPAGTIAADLGHGCPTGTISLSVFCVDLVEDPQPDVFYPWPAEFDPVYIRYQHGQSQYGQTPQVTQWEYVDNYDGHKVFQGSMEISLDALNSSGICGGNINPIQGLDSFQIQVEVVTLINASFPFYDLYPIHQAPYSDIDGIFSCEVFGENCHICSQDGPPSCEAAIPPTYTLTVCVDCSDCAGGLPPETGNNQDTRIAGSAGKNAHLLSVSPNPFNATIRYEYVSSTESDVVVRLFTLTGREVIREIKNVGVGNNTFLLNTEDLTQGVYYLQVGGNANETRRLVKME